MTERELRIAQTLEYITATRECLVATQQAASDMKRLADELHQALADLKRELYALDWKGTSC